MIYNIIILNCNTKHITNTFAFVRIGLYAAKMCTYMYQLSRSIKERYYMSQLILLTHMFKSYSPINSQFIVSNILMNRITYTLRFINMYVMYVSICDLENAGMYV